MSTLDKIIAGTQDAARNFAISFKDSSGDKVVEASTLAGTIGGAVCGIIVASAFWPVCILGGVAGSFILAVGNWNGDFKSRALSALIGFPLGALFGPAMAGAMAGGVLGQKGGVALSAHMQKTQAPAQDGVAPSLGDDKGGFSLASLRTAFSTALKGITAKSNAPSASNRNDPPAPKA